MEGEPHQPNEPTPLPPEMRVAPWPDPLVEDLGFAPRSMYVEMCWLPTLGPTATLLYRRLGSWAEHNPDGLTVDMVDLAQSMGLGESLYRNSKLGRAVCRLVRFDAARFVGDELQVRTALAPLPARFADRLGPSSRRLHETFTTRPPSKRGGNG